MTDKKICVYAIAKNEMKFIDLWLDSMKEADYIVVLDTGSTDGTYEFLQKDPRVTRVEQKIFNPWRFDTARNESMKLIPEDAEIFVCTDPDERFEPGWCNTLREKWVDNATRAQYTYVWSHTETGAPTNVFMYDKIHTKGYHWIFPVHEVLWPDDEKEGWEKEVRLDFGQSITLHHYQDLSVPRKGYMDLLKLAVEEYPNNPHIRHLYCREFILQNKPNEAYSYFFQVLNMVPAIFQPQFLLVRLDTFMMLASLAANKGESEEALYWCNQFLRVDDTYREPYLLAADIYNARKQYDRALWVLNLMDSKCTRHYTWVEKSANWLTMNDFLYANTYLGFGRYEEALELYNKVLQYEPNNVDVLKYKVACLEQMKNSKETAE